MLLSACFENVFRDAEFESIGFIGHHPKRMLTFVSAKKYVDKVVANDSAAAVLCTSDLVDLFPSRIGVATVENPQIELYRLHNQLADNDAFCRKKIPTVIPASCKVHPMACVAENNVKIGENVTIEEFVSIKENSTIGDGCTIRAGSVIGGSGLMAKRHKNTSIFAKHYGGVSIGDGVEILQHVSVMASVFPWQDTVVGGAAIISDFALIGHGVEIGKQTFVAGSACISGSTMVGEKCFIGPSAVICNGINIGDDAFVTMGAVVINDVPDGKTVSGNPAVDHKVFLYDYMQKQRIASKLRQELK